MKKRPFAERVPLWFPIALAAMSAVLTSGVIVWLMSTEGFVPLTRPAHPVELTQEGAEVATTETEAAETMP